MHASRSNSVTQLLFADQIPCVLRGRNATHSLDVQSQSIRLEKKKKFQLLTFCVVFVGFNLYFPVFHDVFVTTTGQILYFLAPLK